MMTYAYALSLSTRHKSSISMLDWGGAIGHYYLLSEKLVPDLEIDYHCKDVPVLAEYGRSLFPKHISIQMKRAWSDNMTSFWPAVPFNIHRIGLQRLRHWRKLRRDIYL
jgi:hypothetical protein